MSTYSLKELLDLWAQSRLSAEQAIGHLFQHLVALVKRIKAIEERLNQLEKSPPPQR